MFFTVASRHEHQNFLDITDKVSVGVVVLWFRFTSLKFNIFVPVVL